MAKKLSEDKRNIVLNGNIYQAVLMLAVPVMINSFIQSLYNLTDTYWLGVLGTEYQSAITLVSPFQSILQNFGSGITVAGSILIAQYLGAHNDREASNMADHVCISTLIFSVICAILCFIISPPLVGWLGATGLQYDYSLIYIRIVILDMPLLYMINIYSSVHQAQGDSVRPMLLNLIGAVVNLIMDPLLMVVLHFGIAGAAFATLFAKLPGALIALYTLTREGQVITLHFKGFRFQKEKVLSIVRIGLPTAIGHSTMQFGFLLMSRSVQAYGMIATTAYGIGNKINSIITLPNNGIGSAISTIVGLNIGAGDKKRADRGFRIALKMAFVYLLIAGLILSRRPIAEFMVRTLTSDDQVVALATDFLCLMAFWCFTNAFYNVTMGLFQGSGHTLVTMIVDASRLWVFRFATLFICQHVFDMGVESVWYSVVVSNASSAVILFALYLTGLWKKDVIKAK